MNMNCALVVTTIFDPVVLEDYFRNFQAYEHIDEVIVYVIPDRKSPSALYERCADLRRRGLRIEYPTLDEQEAYLRRFGQLSRLIPYDSDNRRNVGYLMALESGADFIVSIDDDNYCLDGSDYFAEHSVVCHEERVANVLSASGGWFNICELLDIQPAVTVYPRGFPYFARHKLAEVQETQGPVRIRVNAGLWLLEPDLDAISWLALPVNARKFLGRSPVLDQDTWSPINTQNTALHRDVIVSYYFVRMGYPLRGIPIDRYGDIFSGYFSQVCVRHMGHAIRIGTPVVEHRRNSHDYMRDVTNELACIWVLEDLTSWLHEVRLSGDTNVDAYVSLSHAIEDAVERFSGTIWTDVVRGYFHQVAYCMRKWAHVCVQVI